MYKNLKAEMIKQDISVQQIARELQLKNETVQKKINGDIGISLIESFKIAKLFKQNNSIEYLFYRG